MTFFLLGIDHKTSSIDIREAAYWKRKEISAFWADPPTAAVGFSHRRGGVYGAAAILATCNRFEIYGMAGTDSEAREVVSIFKKRFDDYFADSYIIYGRNNIFRHLVRLAAGLESQIKGELQISSQLGAWAGREDLPKGLSGLVHEALLAGLEIRLKTGLNRPENNIAALLYKNLLEHNHSDDLLNIVVVGTGKIAELFAHYKPQGVRLYFAAHKNILKARELAGISGGNALTLKELPKLLLNVDVLISATASPHRVFDKNYFSKIAALRGKQLYIYDLAIPRDVEPSVLGINGIILKNMDEVVLNDDRKSRLKTQFISH
ncbi:MAG: hypothetical protein Q7S30_04460 [Candidatus Omnitrophota bacterium]|nr:hypothetical protein [Candidatus Omnitrophota bacterium]